MKRKQLVKRLATAYRTGKLKRPRPHIPEHPLILALKALNCLTEWTLLMFKGFDEAHQRSPEEGISYCTALEKSGIFQTHNDTAKLLNQSLERLANK